MIGLYFSKKVRVVASISRTYARVYSWNLEKYNIYINIKLSVALVRGDWKLLYEAPLQMKKNSAHMDKHKDVDTCSIILPVLRVDFLCFVTSLIDSVAVLLFFP